MQATSRQEHFCRGIKTVSIKKGRIGFPFMYLTCLTLFTGFCVSTSVGGVVHNNVGAGVNSSSISEKSTVPTNATLSVSNDLLQHLKSPTKSDSPSSPPEVSNEDYNYSDEDYYYSDSNSTVGEHHHRRHDKTRLAQVIVYFSVIIIALAGVLIKYFVTEYETSQIKAQEQLTYKRLQNPQS